MSLECGECEHDLRGGHDEECSRYKPEIKVGDSIYVEQAWEDEAGNFHDEVAEVLEINDGKMRLKFQREDVTKFLDGADFRIEDYRTCTLALPANREQPLKNAAADDFNSSAS